MREFFIINQLITCPNCGKKILFIFNSKKKDLYKFTCCNYEIELKDIFKKGVKDG